jgi:hypothetical protein
MKPASLDCTLTPSSTELVASDPAGVADVGQMLHGAVGVHDGWEASIPHPHWFGLLGVPPPHVCGAVQVPQFTVPPHPLGIVPQLSPAGHAVMGVHPHWFGLLGVPPPHV